MHVFGWPRVGWGALLLVFMLAHAVSRADSAASSFEEANRLYEEGKYGAAIEKYQAVLGPRRVSPAVLFNLGNAYFKNGELGQAIYYYRRAARLSPRDADILANLHFARDRVSGSASLPQTAWTRLNSYFTVNELAAVAAILFWLALGFMAAVRFRPAWRAALRSTIIGSAIFLVFAVVFLSSAYVVQTAPTAIAAQHQLPIHLGPLTESQPAFIVPDGTELRIENRREGWLQVADRSGRTGWVEESQVLVLP